MPLPPGPPLPTVVQTAAFATRPLGLLRRSRRRYGDTFTLRLAPFGDCVYLCRPEDIRTVFTGDADTMQAGRANSFMEPMVGPQSLLLLDGGDHLRTRKLMLPAFHGESVRRYAALMESIAAAEIERWPQGERFSLRPRMQSITLEVILRAVFGVRERDRLERLRELLVALLETSTVVLYLQALQRDFGPLSPGRRFARLRASVDELLRDEIARRRADPGLGERDDVLSMLVAARYEDGAAMSDSELRDELMTLLLAGHETTATGLSWAFERLVRHPAALARLREEVDAGEDVYLDAVVRETLRVRPVVMDVARVLGAPVAVGGYELPEGVLAIPAIALVQTSSAEFPDPGAFRPERFLEDRPSPYSWIPFGGGLRRCLGASFAQLEMRQVIAAVVRRVELRAADPAPEPPRLRNVTLVPHRGAEVVLERRRGLRARPQPALAGASS